MAAKTKRAVSVESLLLERDQLVKVRDQAFTDKFFSASIKATEKILEIDREIDRLRDDLALASAKGGLARLRLLLSGAIRDGSWIAAEKLARSYALELLQEKQLREQERERKAGQVSDNVLVSDLVLILRGLPSELRKQILREIDGQAVAPGESEEEEA